MDICSMKLSDVFLIKQDSFLDLRGSFIKTFHAQTFSDYGLETDFRESFYSVSKKNVIRGMHFQSPPYDHTKLVYVVEGEIRDVVLDVRKGSPSYGKSIIETLSDSNHCSLYIPKGFAHGFYVCSDIAKVVYMQSSEYNSEHDSGIRWNSFGLDWEVENPILSERDQNLMRFQDFESPFFYNV